MKDALYAYLGWTRFWLAPTNWYWSKDNRRARQFSREYMAEARERGLL